MNTFTITSEHGPFIFQVMYQVAFLSGVVLFLYAGYKRSYPLSLLMLMLALGGLFLMAGTKLGTYSTEDWLQLFNTGRFPATTGKTILTGMLALMVGLLLAKAFLKMNPSVLDLGAIVVPVSMSFQKIGCLFAGCCYGLPTNLPWGVRYAEHYRIFGRHMAGGVTGCTESLSAPVHPIQLYEIVGYVLIIPILLQLRKRMKASGSLVLMSMAMFFGLRFLLEFLRDPATNHGWTQVWHGLNIVQWFSLVLMLAASLWAYVRERRAQDNPETQQPHKGPSTIREVTLAILLSATLWLTYGWFTPLETMVFQCLTLAALALMVVRVVRENSTPAYRWALVSTTGLALVLMAQTVDIGTSIVPQEKEKRTRHQITINHLRGNLNLDYQENIRFQDSVTSEYVPGHYEYDSCEDTEDWVHAHTDYNYYPVHKYNDVHADEFKLVGGEWKIINEMGEYNVNTATFGLEHYMYKLYRNDETKGDAVTSTYGYFSYGTNQRTYGTTVGFSLGRVMRLGEMRRADLDMVPDNVEFPKEYVTREHKFKFCPIISGRVGRRDNLFFEAGINDNSATLLVVSTFHAGVGIGNELFNIKPNFRITAGLCNTYFDNMGIYFNSEVVILDWVYLYPKMVLANKQPIFGLGIGMQFQID